MTTRLLHALPLLLALGLGSAQAAEPVAGLGKDGDAVTLRVGYQPLYAEGWSAMVIEAKQLWKSHLPAGSTVEFAPSAAGGAIIGQMVAGKLQVGYVGDMPALIATSRPDLADLRMVAVAGHSQRQCNVLLVRRNAPDFATPDAATRWLDGKTVAAPHGSCADRFAREIMDRVGAKPAKYFDYGIDGLVANFKSGDLDAAVVWEPAASRLVAEGLARKVATGADFGEDDVALLVMDGGLIQARPDVYRGWLETEADAEAWLADPSHAAELVAMAQVRLPGYPKASLWQALYGGGTGATTVDYDFGFSPRVVEALGKSAKFLAERRSMISAAIRPEAIAAAEPAAVLAQRRIAMPIGRIAGQPDSAFVQ